MSPIACFRSLRSSLRRLGSFAAAAGVALAPLTLPAQPDSPTLRLTGLAADGASAALTLAASPGHYTIQTTPDLAAPWQDALSLVIDGGGFADFTLPIAGAPRLFFRGQTNDAVVLETTGSAFNPILECASGQPATVLWRWSDRTTSTAYPAASKNFGAAAPRQHSLEVVAPARLTKLNLGFNGADGGDATPLAHLEGQNVSRITFPAPLTDLTCFGATHNYALHELDFTGFTSLKAIECFETSGLEHINVTDLPALRRLCVEDGNLQELDLSGLPNLEDVRGALNAYTSITVGRGTGPKIWHWCTRDNPQLTQNFADIMGDFTALEELYIWNTNQHGVFTVGSLVLRDFQAADNHLTSVSLPGRTQLQMCYLANNDLTSVDLSGCTGLRTLNLANNRLDPTALDALLALLDSSCPNLVSVDLSRNLAPPTATGAAHVQNLVARGVSVAVDLPEQNDGRLDVAGGPNAITFTTDSEQPHLEVRLSGPATSVIWHWGDGTFTTGTSGGVASHRFASAAPHTNYVEVVPASAVTYFGAQYGYTGQGLTGLTGVAHFPNLSFLYLYSESVAVLDLAGCAALTQLHLAANPVSSAVCDQWFIDLNTAVAAPLPAGTVADFYFPAAARTSASNAAYQSLVDKGYAIHPM